jgi:iron complex outermembrane receptor protein
MLGQDWASTYTIPQTTQNQLAFLTASATWKPTDTWTYQALTYFRNFRQSHVHGNGTDASNDPTVCPDPTLLCFPNLDGSTSNLTTTRGQTVPQLRRAGPMSWAKLIAIWTNTNSFGGPSRRQRPRSFSVTTTTSP